MIRYCIAVLICAFLTPITLVATQAGAESTVIAKRVKARGDVYLLRGFGNVFSRGLDDMGAKLESRGVDAKVLPHGDWQQAVAEIVKNRRKFGSRPVVLIGHSLGANAIIRMARALKRKRISVTYLVTFAATAPEPVPSNVRKATNYYFKTDGWGKEIAGGAGFRGILKNIDFSNSKTVGHFNIDKQPRLQRQVIRNVLRFVGSNRKAYTTPASNFLSAG